LPTPHSILVKSVLLTGEESGGRFLYPLWATGALIPLTGLKVRIEYRMEITAFWAETAGPFHILPGHQPPAGLCTQENEAEEHLLHIHSPANMPQASKHRLCPQQFWGSARGTVLDLEEFMILEEKITGTLTQISALSWLIQCLGKWIASYFVLNDLHLECGTYLKHSLLSSQPQPAHPSHLPSI
jgi:hypothetical protein